MARLGLSNRVLGAADRMAASVSHRTKTPGRSSVRSAAAAGLQVLGPGRCSVREAAKRLPRDARVVEFGDGRTLWLQEYGVEVVVIGGDLVDGRPPSGRVPPPAKAMTSLGTAGHFPDETFDLAVVDGTMQGACGLAVVPKVKRGGMLLLDRPLPDDFRALVEALATWQRSNLLACRGPATLWMKPV